MKRRPFILLLFLCLPGSKNFAQQKAPVKFGKVSPEDFKQKIYSIDSNASAVIIADVGSTEIVGNSKGGFSLEFRHYKRVHILNKNGYDIGNVAIDFYVNGEAEEELLNLKAVTYNMENGKIVETKLEPRSSIFKERINKHHFVQKFAFPNIKEGSIIEYQYTIQSDYLLTLQPWEFQGQYPALWSEYNVTIPEFLYYVTLSQGNQSFYIKDQNARRSNFSVSDSRGTAAASRDDFTASVTSYRWVMKDVPSLREESFTSTLNNHKARIEFQLAELRPPYTQKNIMGTWTQACEDLLKDENFGYSLDKDNPWLNDATEKAVQGAATDLQKAKNIYAYIRDNMTCINYSAIEIRESLKNVLKGRNGNVAEINLLLIAMLRKTGLSADPILLSTRSHGYTYPMYPLLDRFNYVIAQTVIDDHTYYLDASEPQLGFGKLGYECYNGHARIINADATPVEFTADSLLEKKVTTVFMISDQAGDLSGSVQEIPGYYESYRVREEMKESDKTQLLTEIKKGFSTEAEVSGLSVDSLDKYDEPVVLKYNIEIKPEKGDILYINPMFGQGYKENPFKSAQRFYPVEMPYALDETYSLQMQVPSGYVIDELPKQVILKLNENGDGMFEYRITESNGTISLRSRLCIKRTYFHPDEYEMLREFFNLVVKKHSEQIVLKKKN